ncbi:MAG: Eco57I restriction-modification methylase domain-containing protein [Propionibacteriaceae bacterium]|jgi:adenine-specific DNA-methyltransferase|nr:Eco57I restriction-modification methylase domain-containing protein [Propionibacteriaceae bacterium]
MISLDQASQSVQGQYFTPELAAELIASFPRLPKADCLRVLDPGAGSGMLTAAIVDRVCREGEIGRVEVTAAELDPIMLPALDRTAELCRQQGHRMGVDVEVKVVQGDVIALQTGFEAELGDDFDLVIMNPPYRKLASLSWQRRAMAAAGWETGNLYAAFLALGVDSLAPGGQLVAITPRSFANGPYFEQFRKRLLSQVALGRVHTFESRSTVFADTGVLQENIVLSATKGGTRQDVTITSSRDHTDPVNERTVPYGELVAPDDRHQFIRIITNGADDRAAKAIRSLPASLSSLAVRVSTGRVVDFRARQNLQDTPTPGSLPLIYPGNLRGGLIEWPRSIGKAQGFRLLGEADAKALLPSGYYVAVKRFSAKEERRRIVASVWDPTQHHHQPVAFENHLNVFHAEGKGLDRELAWGLCAWLNSSVVDRHFRTFSGHTQVNATDLRSMNYPDEDALRRLGHHLDVLPGQEELDQLVDRLALETVAA